MIFERGSFAMIIMMNADLLCYPERPLFTSVFRLSSLNFLTDYRSNPEYSGEDPVPKVGTTDYRLLVPPKPWRRRTYSILHTNLLNDGTRIIMIFERGSFMIWLSGTPPFHFSLTRLSSLNADLLPTTLLF